MSTEALADALTRHRVEERERALRALLMRPLMTALDPDFGVVRRHVEVLRGWLGRETGWALRVERDCARLFKVPADVEDGTRGAPGFDRRRYVLMCLVCAVLERADPQITLKTLGERLLELATDPELVARGFRFTLEQIHERRELVHVCRYLLKLGVLHRLAGEEEGYVQHSGDALYDIQRRALAGLLACMPGPSTFSAGAEPSSLSDRLAALTAQYVPDSAEARRTAVRHRVARRMLDNPVVYFDELSEEERDYLANQRGVMAADRLAVRCAPLVCTDGMPSAAQRVLLAQLAAAGAALRYHGDFDWSGVVIGNFVMRTFKAKPWRFGTSDYDASSGRRLEGDPSVADWDAELAPKMTKRGYALDEEAVIDSLLGDLALRSG